MTSGRDSDFVSRGGVKLAHALSLFEISPADLVCADLGSSTGGFVDCLLRGGASKVYAVERGYGVLDYRVRREPRVVVMERTDALSVHLPEPVDLVTIDVGWTRQARILPVARRLLRAGGRIVTLVKPHYEAEASALCEGVLPEDRVEAVVAAVRGRMGGLGLALLGEEESPIRGSGGNREVLWHLEPA
ncbi:MAG: SAM-dependent methyltransferase [Planctomycetota bacterium]